MLRQAGGTATTDIRLKRIEKEYQSVRDGQDDILDRVDAYEEALLRLNQTVVANHEWSRQQFAEVNEKLDRLMAHLNVPPKPPAGFVKE